MRIKLSEQEAGYHAMCANQSECVCQSLTKGNRFNPIKSCLTIDITLTTCKQTVSSML